MNRETFLKELGAALSNLSRAEREEAVTYYDEMIAQFVSGKTPMSEWDTFLAELDKMGLDRYLEIMNEGYQNYKGQQ